ncbi:MAG: CDP-diacylglycerol--glycerol-3-phosphate 3-phosphatidyltransferase [Bavariicoccus seileri]|uniref:CDP-diacylglycerol--glycerol-3-phosphate 3-phosphatidyltransferase n=1 Tax=Bavariicoccus seileri TaxID=549685 RepID=A0A3D4S361_9ENTE|nr:CDP-diacylglycerol--glycerol-3-phosphate 3-phosphatidyltransferase [Bavariicoccus seileri]HCS93190.1 CDP-diacylglycerol--glycerol-3-phosphate 3-phosphatidyltransferase [Bavariicoccus seileri]
MNLPNKLTVIRMLLIPVFILVMAINAQNSNEGLNALQIIATIIFVGASFTDWLDGYIARKDDLVTNFGKFADPMADKMLVMSAFIMLVGVDQAPAWVVTIIVCREIAITGLRTILVEQGEVMAAAKAGKLKTVTQMISIILLLLHDWPFQFLPFSLGEVFLYLALIATVYSGYEYFKHSWSVFSRSM